VPGIAGHSSNDYIKNFIHFCKNSGFKTVVFNWPGCDNKLTVSHITDFNRITLGMIQRPHLWTVGDSKDLKLAVDHIHSHCPRAFMSTILIVCNYKSNNTNVAL